MNKESGRIVIISRRTHDTLDTRNSHMKEDSRKIIFEDVDTLAKPLIEEGQQMGIIERRNAALWIE